MKLKNQLEINMFIAKITHLTSARQRYDTRIFLKECVSLANQKDFFVSLIVADDNGNEVNNVIRLIDNHAYTYFVRSKNTY